MPLVRRLCCGACRSRFFRSAWPLRSAGRQGEWFHARETHDKFAVVAQQDPRFDSERARQALDQAQRWITRVALLEELEMFVIAVGFFRELLLGPTMVQP